MQSLSELLAKAQMVGVPIPDWFGCINWAEVSRSRMAEHFFTPLVESHVAVPWLCSRGVNFFMNDIIGAFTRELDNISAGKAPSPTPRPKCPLCGTDGPCECM